MIEDIQSRFLKNKQTNKKPHQNSVIKLSNVPVYARNKEKCHCGKKNKLNSKEMDFYLLYFFTSMADMCYCFKHKVT